MTTRSVQISTRDFDYIEARLLAPAVAAGEAHERLRTAGQTDLAGRLMEAEQAFHDACRAIRRDLADRYRAERRRDL